jgi:hypothetical protein
MATQARENPTDSEFNMWRAVFAFSLVDNLLSMEEQKLLQSYFNAVPFSKAQIDILKNDFRKPQDVEALYKKITDPKHKERFCVLARALVWSEGDMDRQEELILKKVACLGNHADNDVLSRSRKHPDLESCYQSYAKAGMSGLLRSRPGFEMHA